MAGRASAVSAGSQETPSKVVKRKRKTPQELEEEECRNWRRRANAKGRTLNMSPECIRKSSNASRHPPVSGRRFGRPFLFQTLRGRQILQDSIDSDASSDNECLKTRHLRHKITQRHNESEDRMTLAELAIQNKEDSMPVADSCKSMAVAVSSKPHPLSTASSALPAHLLSDIRALQFRRWKRGCLFTSAVP